MNDKPLPIAIDMEVFPEVVPFCFFLDKLDLGNFIYIGDRPPGMENYD